MSATASETRIPKALQAVFLASNRGNDVHIAPPRQLAFRTYVRKIFLWNSSTDPDDSKYPEKKKKKSRKKTKQLSSTSTKNKGSLGIDKPTGKKSTTKNNAKSNKRQTLTEGKSDATVAESTKQKELSPQDYLDDIMKSRGYSTKRYNTLKTAYHNKPSPLQRASYDLHLIGLVKQSRSDDLNEIFKSGISPNPCNVYGESLVHMVCRRGEHKILKVMIDNYSKVQVADDYGRTPLHDACWASEPAIEAVDILLEQDVSLIQMADCRGFLPLSYVRKDHWDQWIDFLESRKDKYWPVIEVFTRDEKGKKERVKLCSELVNLSPDSRPIPDPINALPLDLAAMVASGTIRPEEAAYLRKRRENGLDDDDTTEGDDDYDDDDSTNSSDSDSSDSSTMDDELLNELPMSALHLDKKM